jgi:hypothetical protein
VGDSDPQERFSESDFDSGGRSSRRARGIRRASPPFQAPEVFEGQRLTIESVRQRRGTGPDVAWEGRLNPALLILGRPQNRGTAERGKCVCGRKQQRQTQLPVICSELQRFTWV